MKKRLVLKRKYKNALVILAVVAVMTGLVMICNELDKDYMKNCMENGYSEYYCAAHK